MIVQTINRMARTGNGSSLALATDVTTPGSDYQNASYGLNGLGDMTVLGDYFTSANYYLGYVGLAAAGYLLMGMLGGSKAKRRATARRANLKGSIARETELLKAS